MSKTAHTPGPWSMSFDPYEDGMPYSHIRGGDWASDDHESMGFRIDTIIREPDASLIAAAPELLAALENAADYIKDLDGGDMASETGWKSDELLDVWLKARAAIAKATGAA